MKGQVRPNRATRRVLLVGAVVAVCVVHLSLGRGVDWRSFGSGDMALERQIFLDLRLPRLIAAVSSGAALAVSGLLLQRVLRNPLASPELTAINPAACSVLLIGVTSGVVSITNPLATAAVALVGGLLGGVVMWLTSRGRSADEVAVVGVLAAMALTGVTTIVLAAKSLNLAGVLRWLIGSLEGMVGDNLVVLVPTAALGVVLVRLAAPALDIVATGDVHASGLGVGPSVWRGAALLLAAVLASAAVAVVGPLAFVGFLAPHMYVALTGGQSIGRSVLGVALLGSAFVTASDAAATGVSMAIQLTGSGRQVGVPAGAVTCLVGTVALARLASRGLTQDTSGVRE